MFVLQMSPVVTPAKLPLRLSESAQSEVEGEAQPAPGAASSSAQERRRRNQSGGSGGGGGPLRVVEGLVRAAGVAGLVGALAMRVLHHTAGQR